MYRCNDCGCEFEEPHEYVERHGFTDGPYETWRVCPCCGSTDFELEFEWDSPDAYEPEEVDPDLTPEEVSLN